ncbi:fanconi-associated nuclease 1 homolog isoform X2 [Nymphaea colorata]|uniref:fanconi-associated nuclease 1 homolog isoform X2 n=1 Tax=Nymphaea colorata TaxID=210225 RepID=UPI00214EF96B|nr:fanconi-associated nuclease 1 homolog isoform X2 [Nymphaea colorata]
MLRGRASLVRLIGRRRRLSDSSFSPPADDASDRRKIQTKSNGESSSFVNELSSAHTVDHSKLEDDENVDEQDLDWVTCPVCGKSIRCIHDIVNSHLDSCLTRRTPRKLSQSTLFQYSFNRKSDRKRCCQDFSQSENDDMLKKSCKKNKPTRIYPSPSSVESSNFETAAYLDICLYRSSDSCGVSSAEDVETKCSVTDDNVDKSTSLNYQDIYISKHNQVSEDDDVPLESLETYIVGRTFYDDVDLKEGANIVFVRDPANVKDQFAIKIFHSDHMLGFLPRALAQYLSPLIDNSYLKLEGFISSLPKYSTDDVPIRVLCQKVSQFTSGAYSHQYFKSLWTNAIRAAESTRTFHPDMKRYQMNFHILMQEVMNHHSYLFTDEERSFLARFEALSSESQRLFIRLYTRKGPWFRVSNVSYPEVLNVELAVEELCVNDYMCRWDPLKPTSTSMFREVLSVLTVQELREFSRIVHVKKNRSGLRREQICDSLMASYADRTCLQLPKLIFEKIGSCISVSYLADSLLWLMQRLFFLNGEHDLSAFLLVDLGLVRYPPYVISISQNLFPSRDDLLAYEEAIKVAQILDESLDKNNMEMVLHCIEASDRYLSSQPQEVSQFSCHQPIGAFLFHFSAAWVYSKVVTLGISVLEHERRYEDAIKLLKQLLNIILCDGKRGYWALRLSVDLEHLGRLDESLTVAEESLADPWVRAGLRIALQRRVLRLGKPPRRWKVPDFAKLLKRKINEVHVRGIPLASKTGIKSRFYGYNGEQCGVEELALQHYAGVHGWQGLHSESGIWMTLFALLMWDVIFADIPDVFRTRFQTSPLDLECDSFYPARESLIESQLQKIEEGVAGSILTASWNAHVGTCCKGVRWDQLPLSDLQLVVSCIKGPTLASLCRMLAQDYRSWSSGMPDLLLWRLCDDKDPSDGCSSGSFCNSAKVKLVEVKGPNDRLSEQQHAWLLALMDCGFEVEVCKIRPMAIDE